MFNLELKKTNNNVTDVKNKSVDLEDRSRRSNLIFYNFPEADRGQTENCERLVYNLIQRLEIFPEHEELWIDRAHRLGQRNYGNNTKPRPIIVKFTYFKQKQTLILNSQKFRVCPINISEDYSRETLDIHKKLFEQAKSAKNKYSDPQKSILRFNVSYRRLVVTYLLNKNDVNGRKLVKSFTLDDITNNSNWYNLPPPPDRNHGNVQHQGTSLPSQTPVQEAATVTA